MDVAIVGVGCRLPGGINDLDGLRTALDAGRDLIGRVPPERFAAERFVDEAMPRTDKSYTALGGFLDDIDRFDAAFFGISPREAAAMDPQQRLLLEMTVEALDDAAIDRAALAGTDTGVFIGISDNSYAAMQMMEPGVAGPYTMSGGALSIAANRLSHVFDLRGPSMAVDTACSSSLVAVERAYRALADGSCRTVLAGGVNALMSPYHYVGFSQAAMLSPTGRCRAFAADADGFVRSEGGGMIVLKRLDDALAGGDRIHGVIVGAGTNSDGRTLGLALPNPEAQEDLLRQVYAAAGIDPDDVAYVEAHGTGTPAGDPAECRALGRVLGTRRSRTALPIGSVKSNLGHLEPASGMAGLFKALLVLRHGHIPASLHAEEPNPNIDFTGLGLGVVTRPRALPDTAERPVAGVNSFGFGGSNAHVILAGPVAEAPGPRPAPAVRPVLVSGDSAPALAEAAARMADHLDGLTGEEFYDAAYTATRRRSRHRHRAVVCADDPIAAAEALRRLSGTTDGGTASQVPGATAEAVEHGRIAFVFSGNGSQWAGMGAELMATDPVFRAAVEQADTELAPRLGWSVREELALPPDQWRLSATEIAQPLLFAVQVGLMESLAAAGVHPNAVLGHSVGEVAAAYAAGALSLPQAAQVIAERGGAQAATFGQGRMAAVGLTEDTARELLPAYPGLEIAAVNTPRDLTVAGPADQVKLLIHELAERGLHGIELDLDYPFHSAAMDRTRAPLAAGLGALRPGAAHVPMVSTVTGAPVEGPELDAGYWWRNVREPVRFAAAVERVVADGCDVLVEIGPHPVLRGYLNRIGTENRTRLCAVPTLTRAQPGEAAVRSAVAGVIAAGAGIEWSAHFPVPGRVRDLPAYPWQRERHWIGSPESWVRTIGDGRITHPLLGERLPLLEPAWHGRIEPVLVPWLADHRVGGAVVMPATGYVEMMLAAGRQALGQDAVELDHLDVERAMVVGWESGAEPVYVQTSLAEATGTAAVASVGRNGAGPRRHARARVRRMLATAPPPRDLSEVRARLHTEVGAEAFYTRVAEAGLAYGPAFQVLTGLAYGDGEVLAGYAFPGPHAPHHPHPALLDGALQAGAVLLSGAVDAGQAYLPSAIGGVRVWRTPPARGLIHVRERDRTADEVCWDAAVLDEDGAVAVEMTGCRLRRFDGVAPTPVTRHGIELRAAPRALAGPGPLPGSTEILEGAAARIAAHRADWRTLGYDRSAGLPEAVLAHTLAAALGEIAGGPELGLADLVAAGVEARHTRLLTALMPLLERHGLAEPRDGDRFRLRAECAEPERVLREAMDGLTAFAAEAALVARCGPHVADLLLGRQDPWELLTSGGAAEMLEQFYDTGATCRFVNRIAGALLARIVEEWPDDRPLRILEIGGGTGGLTATLLPLLPADRTRYTFTDVSPQFLSRAEHRFAAYDFVEYRTFDLDTDLADQDIAPGTYDLVVAGTALHTATDLGAGLRRVCALLAPGGRLLAAEWHRMERLALFFGWLDGFWSFTDTGLRTDSPLLPREQWPEVLTASGFTDVVQTGADDHDDFSVLLATNAAAAAAPTTEPAGADGVWIIAAERADDGTLAAELARQAARSGRHTVACELGTDPAELLAHVPNGTEELHVTVVLDADATTSALATATRRAAALRAVAAACERLPLAVRAHLWLVTTASGALPSGEAGDPLQAATVGIARSLQNEQPHLDVRRVELPGPVDPVRDAARLLAEQLDPDEDDELVLTPHGRFVARAVPTADRHVTHESGHDVPYRLAIRNAGLSYELSWAEIEPPEPGPGQVRIEVRAAALNYRDIMRATDLLPAEAVQDQPYGHELGLECAGVVTAVGAGVTSPAIGDRVFGTAPAALASHAVTSAQAVGRIPDAMTYADAATFPTVFFTVHHALGHCARLRAGETVLVHGGAGGVGLATVQYARRIGARVIATAGSQTKRAYLRSLGVDHVLDSRSLHFAERIREVTGGRGVDVVLNSLAGEAITRSLETLRPGGRFVELGKRDIFENSPLPLRPFGANIAFFGVDAATLPFHEPELAAELFGEVVDLVRDGTYRPIPYTVFPAARVGEAFTLMQHSRHIGKVVVAFGSNAEPVPVRRRPGRLALDPAATYLVVGGLGGFGAATAVRLADRGARHLALVGRRGTDTPGADDVLRDLADRGTRAHVYAIDAADEREIRRVIADADADGRPVPGVVHAAMTLDDDLLVDLTDERIAGVLHPKIAVALALDAATADLPLDLFVLYSSSATMFGNPGQSPYVAGNLFLEALVRRRRREGRPGLAVALGALGETGFLTRGEHRGAAMAKLGIEPTPPAAALDAIEDMLAAGADNAAVGRYNWRRLREVAPGLYRPLLRFLMPGGSETGGGGELTHLLADLTIDEARRFVVEQVTAVLAEVLQMPAEQIAYDRRLDEYGMDSLTGAELLISLRDQFGIEIPPMELLRSGGAVNDVAQSIVIRLGLETGTGSRRDATGQERTDAS